MTLDESYELIILKLEIDGEEESMVTLDDEDEYNELYQIFSERNEEGYDEEEEEDDEE